jgi:hypothetical protein
MASVETLGDTPLAVVSDTKPPLDDPENVPPGVRKAAVRLHLRHQDELAALSSNHVHVVATRSFELLMTNEPAMVVRAVRAVLEAARTEEPLPPCHRVFRGPGVRCRS